GPCDVNWHEQRGARDEVLVIEIAGMDTGRTTADPAQRNIRSDTHRTEERLIDRHNDTARDLRRLGLAVDRDYPTPKPGDLVGQRAGIGPLAIESPVEREVDLQNAHFEHVTRHRALDLDRSGEHMRPRAAVLHLTEDVALVLRDGARWNDAGLIDDFRRQQC